MNQFQKFWYRKAVKEQTDKNKPKTAFRLVKSPKTGQYHVRIYGANGEMLQSSEPIINFHDALDNMVATQKQIIKHGTQWMWEEQ